MTVSAEYRFRNFSCPAQGLFYPEKLQDYRCCIDCIVGFFHHLSFSNAGTGYSPGNNHLFHAHSAVTIVDASMICQEEEMCIIKQIFCLQFILNSAAF